MYQYYKSGVMIDFCGKGSSNWLWCRWGSLASVFFIIIIAFYPINVCFCIFDLFQVVCLFCVAVER